MKQFLLKIGLFAIVFFIIDKGFYYVIDFLPSKQPDRRLEYLMDGKINADILILGSSRAAHNVMAEEMQKQTQMSTHNLGFRGTNIDFHLFILKNYLAKNIKPKKIIYVADVPFMFDKSALVFRTNVLRPFVKYPEFRNVLIQKKELSLLAEFLNLSCFSFSTATKKENITIENFTTKLGSNPLPVEEYEGVGENFTENKKHTISNHLIKQFIEIQTISKNNNIQFFLVIPPNNEKLDTVFVETIKNNLIPNSRFYCYKDNYTTAGNSYFYDISHLNKNGAIVFTTEISTFINQNK